MYIVIEIQAGATTATIVNVYDDRNIAEQAYHSTLSYAAVSSVPAHSVVMMTNLGSYIKSESYRHEPEPEPEDETV